MSEKRIPLFNQGSSFSIYNNVNNILQLCHCQLPFAVSQHERNMFWKLTLSTPGLGQRATLS